TLKLALIVLGSIIQSLPMIALGLLDPYGKRVYPMFRFWSWCVLKIGGVGLRVRPVGRPDPHQAYIFMANHQSNIDIPVLVRALGGFQLRWMAKRELLRVPFFGWALWASKHIIVKRSRSKAVVAAMDAAGEKLTQGISVVVFPEGTRSTDGQLLPFKRGGFRLAEKAGVAIVPVTINGSGALMKRGDWRLKPGEVEVVIGDAVPPDGAQDRSRGQMDRVREAIGSHLARRDTDPDEGRDNWQAQGLGH
ncbi:MAG: lysophospholipid acyltransferase family protein, partial [Deltaproteobacteria bacterium]|nr:lysophospholipid acyltransferase family protein [Deltaproteobacteria bacterium]